MKIVLSERFFQIWVMKKNYRKIWEWSIAIIRCRLRLSMKVRRHSVDIWHSDKKGDGETC